MSTRNGWQRVKFGDVVRHLKDSVDPETSGLERYVAGGHMDTDELQITSWGTIGDGYLGPAFHRRFRSGQVLYGSRRTYLRKVALADFDGVCANTTFVCESADSNRLHPELLPFIMQSKAFHAHSIGQSKGSVNPYINWSDLAWFEFDLPPIDEQRNIAELLWATERLRRCLVATESRMAEARLIVEHRLLLERVSGWPLQPLATVTRFANGCAFPQSDQGHVSGEIPFIKVSDLDRTSDGIYVKDAANWISSDQRVALKATVHPVGTVVFAKVGAALKAERRRILGAEACFDNNIMGLVPDETITPEFLHLCLDHVRFADVVQEGAVPSINQKIVGAIRIPIPPASDQQDILRRRRVFRDAETALEAHLLRTTRLKSTILEQL